MRSPLFIDLTGKTFNRLTVLGEDASRPTSHWRCMCACGKITVCAGRNLKTGTTKSCGCLRAELATERNTTHGYSFRNQHSDTYKVWAGMRKRCNTPSCMAYPYYGGRGIKVCAQWDCFENFLADMGEKPQGMSIDRINGDGDYTKDNCQWAEKSDQIKNRSSTRYVEAHGKRMTISEWSTETGLTYYTIYLRLRRGMSDLDAVAVPNK